MIPWTRKWIGSLVISGWCLVHPTRAADKVYSGPQPGEKTGPFKVLAIGGALDGPERDPITDSTGRPLSLVFVHVIERSLVPLLRVIDEYGAMRSNSLRTEVVFLAPDRIEGERRVKAAVGSLKLHSRTGLSVDGAEGPGAYGLNKECMMTLVTAKDNRVATNFALVQPGIADAPAVIAALARISGDTNPPLAADLLKRHQGRGENRMGAARGADGGKPKENFPGAPPTDPQLLGLLRSFIKPTNDTATVDRVMTDVRSHIRGNADLRKQALDGWVRILHFGDRYGTEYARKVGTEFVEELKKPAP